MGCMICIYNNAIKNPLLYFGWVLYEDNNPFFTLLFSRQQALSVSPLQSPGHLGGPLLDTLHFVNTSLTLESPKLNTTLHIQSHRRQKHQRENCPNVTKMWQIFVVLVTNVWPAVHLRFFSVKLLTESPTVTCGHSGSGGRFCICFCWTSWGFCSPYLQSVQLSCRAALLPVY